MVSLGPESHRLRTFIKSIRRTEVSRGTSVTGREDTQERGHVLDGPHPPPDGKGGGPEGTGKRGDIGQIIGMDRTQVPVLEFILFVFFFCHLFSLVPRTG